MRSGVARKVALGGMLAAVSVVIMTMGGLIPLSTYVCPVLCVLICYGVMRLCGKRIAWAWYAAVCLLTLLFGPDKEAAGVFVFFGFYPMIKEFFHRFKLRFLLKMLYFNAAAAALYAGLIWLFGFTWLITEFQGAGVIGFITILVLANVTFILVDRLLGMLSKRFA